MNLVVEPILTPSKDKKDANKAEPSTRKREKILLIESRLETRAGTPSIGFTPAPNQSSAYILSFL